MSDINDNSPVFQSDFINLTLSESIPLETPVLNLVATDSDFGINGLVNYTILYEQSETTGIITEGSVSVYIGNAYFTLEVRVL